MRTLALAALCALPLVIGCVKAQPPTDTGDPAISTPTSPSSGGTTPGSGTTPSTLAYNPDIKALLQSDCISCHGTTRADGGVRLSTYAQVMTTVRAGSPSSLLVTTTQSNGSMYRYWSGSSSTRQSKAASVRSWVVSYNAQENR
jgi:hypothetical protein